MAGAGRRAPARQRVIEAVPTALFWYLRVSAFCPFWPGCPPA